MAYFSRSRVVSVNANSQLIVGPGSRSGLGPGDVPGHADNQLIFSIGSGQLLSPGNSYPHPSSRIGLAGVSPGLAME